MGKKKSLTIHKANEIVRGGDNLSVYGKRALNAIYYLIQVNVNKGNVETIKRLEYIPLEFTYLRKMMNLEKVESYIKEIEKAFNWTPKNHSFKQFKNPRGWPYITWYSISFISEASWKLDNNKKIVYVALPPLIKWLMTNTNNGNFTKLELIDIVNKLRTKYAWNFMNIYKVLEGINT